MGKLQKVRNFWRMYRQVIMGAVLAALTAGMGWYAWYAAHRKSAASPVEYPQVTHAVAMPAPPTPAQAVHKHEAAKSHPHRTVHKSSKKMASHKKRHVKKGNPKPWFSK